MNYIPHLQNQVFQGDDVHFYAFQVLHFLQSIIEDRQLNV